MKRFGFALVAITLSLLAVSDGHTGKSSLKRAMYFPFGWESFVPMGKEEFLSGKAAGIPATYDVTSLFRDEFSELEEILSVRGTGIHRAFDEKRVRLMIERSDGPTLWVDANGNVAIGKDVYSLSEKGLNELKDWIHEQIPPCD